MMFWYISGGILILLTLTSPLTGLVFTISEEGHYERGIVILFALLWLVVAYITLMVVNFKKYSACEFADKFRLVFLFLFELVAIILQFFWSDKFSDAIVSSALITILYYAFVIEIESKYDQKSGVFSVTYYKNYVNTIAKSGDFALILYDVNGLKYTNDNFGHEKGDDLIAAVAVSVKDAVGDNGKVFRLGGDEFMAVVNPCGETMYNEIVNKSLLGFSKKSEELGINVSAAYGIASRDKGEDIKDLMMRADKKMYECKQAYYQQESNNRRGRR